MLFRSYSFDNESSHKRKDIKSDDNKKFNNARDTFKTLYALGIMMEAKPFAVGFRVEHPQKMIDESQYGTGNLQKGLPVADYKVTYHASNGRSVYSFCMCPGGYVVNASSEEQRLAVNGMSYHARPDLQPDCKNGILFLHHVYTINGKSNEIQVYPYLPVRASAK